MRSAMRRPPVLDVCIRINKYTSAGIEFIIKPQIVLISPDRLTHLAELRDNSCKYESFAFNLMPPTMATVCVRR